MSAEIPAEAQIHPQPYAQPVLPAATVHTLATLLAHLLVADLTQYPRAPDAGDRSDSGSLAGASPRRTQP